MFLCILATVLLMVISAPVRAEAGDKIVRGGLTSGTPTANTYWGGIGQTDFLDPRFPPLGRFDSLEEHNTSADGGFGFGLGFEYMLSELIGIDTNFNYSKHNADATFSGEITFTPLLGEPPALAPERSETATIIGTGPGDADLKVITVGANFHVLRREKLDLYLGPVVGLALLDSELTSGGFTATFESFVSSTPAEHAARDTVSDFVFGAAFGIDVAMGREGWIISAATKYLAGSLSPWTIQIGLGYRF
jgi:opacity protein-like surface antigen